MMNGFKPVAIIFGLSLVALTSSLTVKGDEWNRKTTVTFNAPVEIPGVGAQTLPAGTYVFKVMDSAADRHIVQVSNESETHVYSTILAIPNYRLRATDKTVMTFKERTAGEPEAIRAWFYPGRQWGEEFVYPKARAIELAKIINEPVLALPTELAAAPIEELKTAQIVAVTPKGEEVEVAQVVEPPPVEVVTAKPAVEVAAAKPQERLPQTASPLPLVGLIGLLSLGAGVALTVIPKRGA
jgi:hypothetical protein